MSAERSFTDQDYELLSAYLDGALPAAERAALEARLQADAALQRELDALRQTVNLLSVLPLLKAPRNLTLTSEMVRARPKRWLIFPTTAAFSGLAAAAATILILLGLGSLLLQGNAAVPVSAPNVLVQEGQSQVAVKPTEAPLVSEKTDEREASALMTAAAQNTMVAPTATSINDELSATSGALEMSPNSGPVQPISPTAESVYGYVPQATSGEETAQQGQFAGPPEGTVLSTDQLATVLAEAEIVTPVAPSVAPLAAVNAPTSNSANTNAQSGAAGAVADQSAASLPTGTPALDRTVLTPGNTSPPSRTPAPTSTPTTTPTLAPTATSTATLTPPPPMIPTSLPPSSVSASRQAGETFGDILPLAALAIGILLLGVAVVTTMIRRRG